VCNPRYNPTEAGLPKINVYLPDDLADEVKAHDLPVSAICQAALRKEIEKVKTKEQTGMEEIQVEIGDPRDVGATVTASFIGRWLVEPDSDDTRTGLVDQGYDAGAYWGVALTKRGRIAVYTAHCNDGWPAELHDFDTLDEAELPDDILAMAKGELGEEYVIRLDI
jgi:Post-segregation antitoxin CcdA